MSEDYDAPKIPDLDRIKRLAHIGRLSAGIGHNIMTPLSLIMMNSDLLSLKLKGQEELRKHVDEITQQVSKISKIVETLMWKVNTEEQDSPSLFQVGTLIEENVQFWMGDMFFKHKLEKEIQINPQTPPVKGIPFHFTSFMDEWVLRVIERARPQEGGKLRIEVDSPAEETFFISFEDSLPALSEKEIKALRNGIQDPDIQTLFPALSRLLTHNPAMVEVTDGQEGGVLLRLSWTLQ